MTELATARYADFISAMGVPVVTSLGRPRFPLSYKLTEEVGHLKPWGLFGKGLSHDDFTAPYRQRLDKIGPDALGRHFQTISRRHGGARIVLLCFERCDQFCHRRVFADYWLERTGQHVPQSSWLHNASGITAVCWEAEKPA